MAAEIDRILGKIGRSANERHSLASHFLRVVIGALRQENFLPDSLEEVESLEERQRRYAMETEMKTETELTYEKIGFPSRVIKLLMRNGITPQELPFMTDADLHDRIGMGLGRKTLDEIRARYPAPDDRPETR